MLTEEFTNTWKFLYKANKKNCKVTFIIHQFVDETHFEKIARVVTSEKAWQTLEKCI